MGPVPCMPICGLLRTSTRRQLYRVSSEQIHRSTGRDPQGRSLLDESGIRGDGPQGVSPSAFPSCGRHVCDNHSLDTGNLPPNATAEILRGLPAGDQPIAIDGCPRQDDASKPHAVRLHRLVRRQTGRRTRQHPRERLHWPRGGVVHTILRFGAGCACRLQLRPPSATVAGRELAVSVAFRQAASWAGPLSIGAQSPTVSGEQGRLLPG